MKAEREELDGQMNLFDVFSGKAEKASEEQPEAKEVEKEADEFYPIHRKAVDMQVVMHKIFEDMLEKEKIVVAYLDYNVIYYKEKKNAPQLLQFANAKLAVNHYMEIVERLRDDEMLIEDEGNLKLEDV